LVNIVHDLTDRGVGLKVLTGQGAAIDTTTASGKLVFGIFAALAEFERELISERTKAGLESARARGRNGGRPYKMTPAKVRLAMASMGQSGTNVGALCQELGISRQTLYRHLSPTGELRDAGRDVMSAAKRQSTHFRVVVARRQSCRANGRQVARRSCKQYVLAFQQFESQRARGDEGWRCSRERSTTVSSRRRAGRRD